ncbi:MAG: PAS domain S-box-containing protein [Salibacteraceae bacterium]|jgi:PAS domain S-box-containing protein
MDNNILHNGYYKTLSEKSKFRIIVFKFESPKTFRIIECNANAAENSNRSKSDLIGKTLKQLLGESINSNSLNHLLLQLNKCLEKQTPIFSEERVFISGVLYIKKNQYLPISGNLGQPKQIMVISHLINNIENTKDKWKECQAKYDRILNTTFSGVLTHKKGIALEANETFLDMFGFSRNEVIGKDIVSKIVVSNQENKIVHKIKNHEIIPGVLHAVKKTGEIIHIQIEASFFNDQNNQNTGLLIVKDITEQKRTDLYLKQSKSELSKLQKISKMGSWTMNVKTLKVTQSKEHQLLFEQTPQKDNQNIKEYIQQVVHSQDHKLLNSKIRFALKNADSVDYYDQFEIRILDQNKNDRWILITSFYKNDEEIEGITQDITTLKQPFLKLTKQKEAALENEKRLLQVTSMSHLGYFEYDILSRDICYSEEMKIIYGLDDHQKGFPLINLLRKVDEKDLWFVIKSIQSTIMTKGKKVFQHCLLGPNGKTTTVAVTAEVQFNNSQPHKVVGTVLDITPYR